MREIAAASDFDFVAVDRPARKPQRPKAKGDIVKIASAKGSSGKAASRSAGAKIVSPLVLAWRYRTPLIGCFFFVGILVMIPVNALLMQHGRHPAPLLGNAFKHTSPKAGAPAAPVPALAKAEPVDLTAPAAADGARAAAPAGFAPAPTPRPAALSPAASAPPAAANGKNAARDVIGSLIEGGTAAAALPPTKTILAAQHALQKLGAPVKADGEFGAATRQAISAFQREHGLPVDGELTPRLRRALAARSGLPIE